VTLLSQTFTHLSLSQYTQKVIEGSRTIISYYISIACMSELKTVDSVYFHFHFLFSFSSLFILFFGLRIRI